MTERVGVAVAGGALIDVNDEVGVAVAGGALMDVGVADGLEEVMETVATEGMAVVVGVAPIGTLVEVGVTPRINASARTVGCALK